MSDLSNWQSRDYPPREVLQGRYVRLEPMTMDHLDGLYEACNLPDIETRFRWLPDMAPKDKADLQQWMQKMLDDPTVIFFVLVDMQTGKIAGRQAFLNMEPQDGSIEIGHIYWGPLVTRRPAATEAQFLFAQLIFDHLGYRRYEWKCNNDNLPSRQAAQRFGFQYEGLFRQHRVVKGENRDTAWFSIIDKEWPALREAYLQWLDPQNFTTEGLQKQRLQDFIQS